MESETAFVRSDGAVHLDPKAPVDVDLSLIVHPGDAEHDDPFRLHHPLQDLRMAVLRMTLQHKLQGFCHLLDCLVEFRLGRILGLHLRKQAVHILRHTILEKSRYIRIGPPAAKCINGGVPRRRMSSIRERTMHWTCQNSGGMGIPLTERELVFKHFKVQFHFSSLSYLPERPPYCPSPSQIVEFLLGIRTSPENDLLLN